MLSTLFTLGLFIAGAFAEDLRDLGAMTQNHALGFALRALYYLLPNFHNFNVIAAVAHGESIPASLVGQNTLYAALYITIVLLGASAIFANRNLK